MFRAAGYSLAGIACYGLLFGRLKKSAGLGNVFMGYFINKDYDCLGRFVGFFADHFGNAFADFLFLVFGEGAGDPDIDVWHKNSLNVFRGQ